MRRQFHTQIDLFATPYPLPDLTGVDRQKAIELLRALLKEAATRSAIKHPTTERKGASNE
jgi:hypothetical protein